MYKNTWMKFQMYLSSLWLLYYQRLLSSQGKDSVRNEIQILEKGIDAKDIIRDPYVLEFLGLDQTPNLYEKDIEQGLIICKNSY